MKLIKAIEQILKEKEWAVSKNATLTYGEKELTIADLESEEWGITTAVTDKKLAKAITELANNMKQNGIDYIDSDGNKGWKQ